MKTQVMRIVGILVVGAGLLAAELPAHGAPLFARKYGFTCTMCHSSYPRLNDFGQRYRDNGYELPGRESDEQTVLQGPAPFAARTSAGYNRDRFTNAPESDSINEFQLNGLDILSGGLLARDIGYFLIYTPEIKGSRGVAPQTGRLEMGNAVFSHVGKAPLNIRVGRFEGAWLPFSAKRSLTLSPYEVYDLAGAGGLALSETPRCGYRLAAGWVDGSSTNRSGDGPGDYYVRVAKIFGEGEGQTAGHRLGAFGYFGRARPMDPAETPADRGSFSRWGLDGAVNFREWSLEGQWLQGTDDGTLSGAASDDTFTGGFLQAMYLPNTRWVGIARYDWVNTSAGRGADITRWTIAGRYYFADNIALHGEYSHRDQSLTGVPSPQEEFFTTRVDWAF
jgi:hypothetical protein